MPTTERKRPWRIRWFSNHWNEYRGKAFGSRDRAVAAANELRSSGVDWVQVWLVNERGEAAPGSMRTIR